MTTMTSGVILFLLDKSAAFPLETCHCFHFFISLSFHLAHLFWSHFPCLDSFVLLSFLSNWFYFDAGLHFSGGSCIWKKVRTIELLIIIILCPFRASFIWEYQSICQTGIYNDLHHTKEESLLGKLNDFQKVDQRKYRIKLPSPFFFPVSQPLGPLGYKEIWRKGEQVSLIRCSNGDLKRVLHAGS